MREDRVYEGMVEGVLGCVYVAGWVGGGGGKVCMLEWFSQAWATWGFRSFSCSKNSATSIFSVGFTELPLLAG